MNMPERSALSHPWDVSPKEAVLIQKNWRDQVEEAPLPENIRFVAGGDISFDKFSPTLFAGFVVLELPSLQVVERVWIESEVKFPYIPGLLSFREIPPLMAAFRKLEHKPDVVVIDGQGLAHPRRFGVACHFGLVADVPTVGCAKSRFVGEYEPPEKVRGNFSPLMDKDEQVGAVLVTKNKVNPIFVSRGHRSNLQDAMELLLRCDGGYRIPEPTRLADQLVNEARRGDLSKSDS